MTGDNPAVDDPVTLVERIRAGDPGAEAELVARYGNGLSYLLRKITGDPVLSEDLLQETFRVALRRVRAGELREPEKLGGFLRATAKNLARAEHRRGGRWESMDDGTVEPADPGESQLAQVIRTEEAGLVRRVLGELRSRRDRQLLYRFYIAEEEKEEICRDLGLSSLNFNLVLFRARERFRKLVEEAEDRRLAALRREGPKSERAGWSDGP
ncbi:MAG TPA: sigma-70 family RNA polymerase sigma factor [Thermoanaerobaculia bacterium]|nr:sigma-70 family RNA polymerase sigma factor [Thermoanaerobaculia bacterium]